MINKLCLSLLLCFFSLYYSSMSLYAQGVSINEDESDPDASAMLDVKSTTRGMLIPRMSEIQKNAIIMPIKGLLIYQNTGTEGFYYFDGLVWKPLVSTGATTTGWALEGNAGTSPFTNFVGTTDARDLAFRTNNITRWRMTQKGQLVPFSSKNGVLIGWDAGNSILPTGFDGAVYIGYFAGSKDRGSIGNVGIGYEALKKANSTNIYSSSGSWNTAIGYQSMSNTLGSQMNVAIGYRSLQVNANGQQNVAVGYESMKNANGLNNSGNTAVGAGALKNASGRRNVALGAGALSGAVSGDANIAVGFGGLNRITTGYGNLAIGGDSVLYNLTQGNENIAIGTRSMVENTNGQENIAIGKMAIALNTVGDNNVGIGTQALYANNLGNNNIGIGERSLYLNKTGNNNVVMGWSALTHLSSGSNNTVMGSESGFDITEANNITLIGSDISVTGIRTNITALGYGIADGQFTDNYQIALGNTSITAIRSQVSGITTYSDKRFKTNIKEDVKGLDFIMRLRPVTYNVRPTELHKIWGTDKKDMEGLNHQDIEKKLQMGFIAQEVEQAAKETGFNFVGLDVPKSDKEVYTLRYTDFVMPLVKAVQELKQQNDILQKENEELKAKTSNLETKLNEVEKLRLEIEAIKAQLKDTK